jgi:hypothetical protein
LPATKETATAPKAKPTDKRNQIIFSFCFNQSISLKWVFKKGVGISQHLKLQIPNRKRPGRSSS